MLCGGISASTHSLAEFISAKIEMAAMDEYFECVPNGDDYSI